MHLVPSLRNITRSHPRPLTSLGCIPLSRYDPFSARRRVLNRLYPDLLVPGRRCPNPAMQILYRDG